MHASTFFRFIAILLMSFLCGCSNYLFYPLKGHLHTPEDLQLTYQDIFIKTEGEPTLHAWWLPASTEEIQGSVLFLHGNAENVSTHFANVAWLPGAGFNVLALDYRGYGLSAGEPDLHGVLTDIDRAFSHLLKLHDKQNKPVIVLGQSIGGALALSYLGESRKARERTDILVVDSAFESFPGIAREKLNEIWLTWPFQYPLSWLITSQYDPKRTIKNISPIPILFFHSTEDIIIPYHHGEKLYALANEPKKLITTGTRHIGTFMGDSNRKAMLDFINEQLAKNK